MNRRLIFISFILMVLTVSLYTLAQYYPVIIPLSKQASTLSPTTYSLLKTINHPLELTLYSPRKELYQHTKFFVEQYQQSAPMIHFSWEKSFYSLSDQYKGEALVLKDKERIYIIDLNKDFVNEATLTQTLFKCLRHANNWVVFIQGHGEPDPFGNTARDFKLLRTALENQGLKIQTLSLNQFPVIADNVQLVIITPSQGEWMLQEEILLRHYISSGKDVLWLIDPDAKRLSFLETLLGISPLPGTIVDLHGQKLGTPHPAITLIEQYPALPFTAPSLLSAYPWSSALKINASSFEVSPLLLTHGSTWTETSPLTGSISFNPEKNEKAGPLLLGLRLTRTSSKFSQEQRIAVIGNSRFLSNGVIQNYGNLAFGLNLINWLNHDDLLLTLEQPVSTDSFAHIHLTTARLIQYGFPSLGALMMFIVFLYSLKRSRSHKSLNF